MSDRRIYIVKNCNMCPHAQTYYIDNVAFKMTCAAVQNADTTDREIHWHRGNKPMTVAVPIPDWCPLYVAEPGMYE